MGDPLNVLSLFSGIGALDRGVHAALSRLGIRIGRVTFVEREAASVAVLVAAMDRGELAAGHVWAGDIHRLPIPASVDAVIGGFPCQAYSSAARGRNVAPNLLGQVIRIVAATRPRWVFLENVQRRAMLDAAHGLDGIGYTGAIARLSSAQVGAADDRRRWWLLAHADDQGEPALAVDDEVARAPAPARSDWWDAPGPAMVDVVHGPASALGRRLLGNCANPIAAEQAFLMLWQELTP